MQRSKQFQVCFRSRRIGSSSFRKPSRVKKFYAIDPLHEKLKKDLVAIGNEISNLWMHHDLFWRMTDITNKNERVMEIGGDYLAWFKNSYIEAGSVAFRRQLDRDKRSISMVSFLLEVQTNHSSFTREGFQGKITFSPGN